MKTENNMATFTFTIDTGHAPMRDTTAIAAALVKVANLIEPWRTLNESGRDVTDSTGSRIGAWEMRS